jgi:hypothetical protein
VSTRDLEEGLKQADEVGPASEDRLVLRRKLQALLKEFEPLLETWCVAQGNVEEAIIDDEALDKDIDASFAFKQSVLTTRNAAQSWIERLSPPNAQFDELSLGSSKRSTSIRLPKLTLPTFDGKVLEWTSWWEQFNADIHLNEELPDISKFSYLRSLVGGEAAQAIAGLALTSENYPHAVELLQDRFGRKELIITSHIQSLLSLDASKSSTLRHLLDTLQGHVRSLKALGIDGGSYGVILTPIILSRLPDGVRMAWARVSARKESNLDFLLKFVQEEIESRERSDAYSHPVSPQPERRRHQESRPTATSLQQTTKTLKKMKPCCAFCRGGHRPWKCPEVSKLDISRREQLVRQDKLCYACLSPGHMASDCTFACPQCSGKHHRFLCKHVNVQSCEAPSLSNLHASNLHSQVSVAKGPGVAFLQTAQVLVQGAKASVRATVLFDSGSDTSYVTESLVKKAGLTWKGACRSAYATFGGQKSCERERDIFEVSLSDKAGSHMHRLEAVAIPSICLPLTRPRLPEDLLQSMRGLELADPLVMESKPAKIDILIGLDHYWRLMKGELTYLKEGLVLQNSVFGWVLSGSCDVKVTPVSDRLITSHQLLNIHDVSEETIRSFWNLESLGIGDGSSPVSVPAMDIVRKNGRYEVGLLWKKDPPVLVNNLVQAKKRLLSLNSRLSGDLRNEYEKVFKELEVAGFIEEVPKSEVEKRESVFYLPHRPVVKESSCSTKVRPVFDASAAGPNGVSLNDCLDSGPALLPSVVDLVLRFRRWKFALVADVTKAFLQVGLRQEDRDVHRFLLLDGDAVRVMRFLRVTFGVNCSPYLLSATIQHHLKRYPEDMLCVLELRENLYVDDWLTGANTEEEAAQLFEEACSVMQDAGMSLSKWMSNSGRTREFIEQSGGSVSGECGTKVLGLKWLPKEDAFTFESAPLPSATVATKRVVLSCIARLFDPLGYVAPVCMTGKILFQRIWSAGKAWDDPLSESMQEEFISWIADVAALAAVRIPRSYFEVGWFADSLELHVFGDASESAYGCCVYLRSAEGKSSLVMARARVAPLKKITLPRLELTAALLAARLVGHVKRALQLPDSVPYRCWTDSTVALHWIREDASRWKPYVANRVRDITALTNPASWSHCRGTDNPADLLTRGLSSERFFSSQLWWQGPSWLPGGNFPSESPHLGVPDVVTVADSESRQSSVKSVLLSVESVTQVFPVSRWSSLKKAIRIVGWVTRFLHNCRRGRDRVTQDDLSFEEMSHARSLLVKHVQLETFGEDIQRLKKGLSLHRNSSLLKLDPMIGSDGLLRVKGRLQRSALDWNEQHPIILPEATCRKTSFRPLCACP